MSFSKTISHSSKTLPGVIFVVHRIGFARGTDIDFAVLAHRQRMRELEAEYPPPTDQEKEITEALEIAKRKALAVPKEEFEAVLTGEVKPLADELTAAAPVESRKKRAVIDEEYRVIDARIRAQWIRSGLVSIDFAGPLTAVGAELAGMTVDQLLEYGPPQLAVEIYDALVEDGKLREPEKKTSPSQGISGAAMDGASPSLIATAVEAPPAVITQNVTASATSQAM